MPQIEPGYLSREPSFCWESGPAWFPPPLPSQLLKQPDEECGSISQHLQEVLAMYLSLFPSDYNFRKDELTQMWMAEGWIQNTQEDVASVCFSCLTKAGFLKLSTYRDHADFDNLFSVPIYDPRNLVYKVNSIKLSEFLVNVDQPIQGFNKLGGRLDVGWESTRHLSVNGIVVDDTLQVLQKLKYLHSLNLFGCKSSLNHIPHVLFLMLKDLRILNLSQTRIRQLPNSIQYLKFLGYLDLSGTPIERLPNAIGTLQYLQTLKLRECYLLHQLPRGMKKLINLRHLDFNILGQLGYMPPYIGNLNKLQTLSAFVVGREDGCRIEELKTLNDLKGVLTISRLENVSNKKEAQEAGLIEKNYLQRLVLLWGEVCIEEKKEQDEILESLQPHSRLKELQILNYAGSVFPAWMSNPSLSELVVLTLFRCNQCEHLPSIGTLPLLRSLSIIEVNQVKQIDNQHLGAHPHPAFPELEILEIDSMLNLEEWKGVDPADFPSLLKLKVDTCPQLHILPFFGIETLKHLELSRCPKLRSLTGEGLLTSLECFMLTHCPELKARFRVGNEWSKISHVPKIWFDLEQVTHSGIGTSVEISEVNMELEDLHPLTDPNSSFSDSAAVEDITLHGHYDSDVQCRRAMM